MCLQLQDPSLDIQFFVYARKKQLEHMTGSAEAMTALSRVRLEGLKGTSDSLFLKAKEKQVCQ